MKQKNVKCEWKYCATELELAFADRQKRMPYAEERARGRVERVVVGACGHCAPDVADVRSGGARALVVGASVLELEHGVLLELRLRFGVCRRHRRREITNEMR